MTDGQGVRELVLVDAQLGRVLLRVDRVTHALNRRICDADNQVTTTTCSGTASSTRRTEGGAAAASTDVDDAYDHLGATAAFYQDIGGFDLTELIGLADTVGGPKALAATVRQCETTSECPMQNAYWNGRQTYLGEGWAVDDVVGHELTHGVIEKYADLFYFHESGAINESIADILGEIIDRRHPSASDSASDWRVGEDLSMASLRDLSGPTRHGQPDRMTSPLWEVDPTYADNGGVHTNSGVGNKTAYLISQGGQFNGRTITGLDSGDPNLTKTATLYLDVLAHLVSGSQYDDLGRVLVQSCQTLAGAGTAGFVLSDCDQVLAATRATELALRPAAAGAGRPAEAPEGCPDGATKRVLQRTGSQFVNGGLWFSAPDASFGVPENDRGGDGRSMFGFNPDRGA